jgi:hypothetical protein
VWQNLATKGGPQLDQACATQEFRREYFNLKRMVATAAELSRLGYQQPFLMGLGFDRVWLVTLTVFGPGLPFRSGRQITFAIRLTSFPEQVAPAYRQTINGKESGGGRRNTDGAIRDPRQLYVKNGKPRLNYEHSVTV